MPTTEKKKTLILGASPNPQRYSYLALDRLRNAGHEVVAIGKKSATVKDVTVDTEKVGIWGHSNGGHKKRHTQVCIP